MWKPYRRRRLAWSLAAAALGGLVAGLLGPVAVRRGPVETLSGFARVIDGDSLRIGQEEMRLSGIDAPELAQTCRYGQREAACGDQAKQALAEIVRQTGRIRCEVRGRDAYGRGLARCFAGELEINARLVADGQAVAYGGYEAEQEEARAARRGIWATRFERPADWRASHPRSAER